MPDKYNNVVSCDDNAHLYNSVSSEYIHDLLAPYVWGFHKYPGYNVHLFCTLKEFYQNTNRSKKEGWQQC